MEAFSPGPRQPSTPENSLLLKPGHFVVGLLAIEALLLLCKRYEWLGIGSHKGWAVLTALAAVIASLAILGLCYLLGLFFGWRFRFTLWFLLLLQVAVVIPCAWFAMELHQARKQQAAVHRLEALNCQIDYLPHVDTPEYPWTGPEPRPAPTLLRRLLGDYFFEDAGRADCESSNQPEKCLNNLKNLPQLRELWLGNTGLDKEGFDEPSRLPRGRVTDAGLWNLRSLLHLETLHITGGPQLTDSGLDNLSNLQELQRLSISGCPITTTKTGMVIGGLGITDKGLEKIGALPNLWELNIKCSSISAAGLRNTNSFHRLRRLNLWACRISDAGLERLKHIPNLRVLVLNHTDVSDAGFQHIGAMTELRALSLFHTKVSDAGMEHLKDLTKLRSLDLSRTQVSDAGLKNLSGLTQLEQLDLHDTRVSDAGLEHLKRLTNLRGLDFRGTKVSQARSDAFRRLNPSRFIDPICESYLSQEVIVRNCRWLYIDPFDD